MGMVKAVASPQEHKGWSVSLSPEVLPVEVTPPFEVPALPLDMLKKMYSTMLLIRRVEEYLLDAASEGRIGGAMHTAIGMEANAVGAAFATRPDDYVTCTYRGHHHAIARGLDAGQVIAEVLGKATGCAKGKGGSMHMVDPEHGLMGANGVVAAQVPHAAGMALAAQMRQEDRIALTFFGDGAIYQGVMHETFNIAAKWKLPIVFYMENNKYSEMTPIWRTSSIEDLYTFPRVYGIESIRINGNDVEVVHAAVQWAAERARKGEGPTFIEAITYRLAGHMAGDLETYRTPEERERQRQADPVLVLRQKLLDRGMKEEEITAIEEEVAQELSQAIEFAEQSPWPDIAEAYTDVFYL